jgi:hypothetical protein
LVRRISIGSLIISTVLRLIVNTFNERLCLHDPQVISEASFHEAFYVLYFNSDQGSAQSEIGTH